MTSTTALLLLLLLLPAGCVNVPSQDAPAKKFFVLDPGKPAAAPAPAFASALLVRDARVAPPFAGRSLIYRTGPDRFETDYYHLFLTAPEELATRALRQWFGAGGLFPYVVLPGSDARRGLVLETLLTDLYGDFGPEAGNGQAVVALQAFLLREDAGGKAVVLHRDYDRRLPLETRTPEALVAGFNRALADILAELSTDLAGMAATARDLP